MIKLRDLQYLDAIAKFQHFGKAASFCSVSQPTLSGQILKLEQQLGLTLVERKTRNVMLTAHGEQLIVEARNILAAVNRFEESAKSMLDPFTGELHIGLIPTLAPYLLPHIMAELNTALPNISFILYENKTPNLLRDLDNGKLDALILPWLDSMDNVERYDLFNEPFVLATPTNHKLANIEPARLESLVEHRILTLEDGHCLRDQAMGYCFSAGATEDQSFRATSLETLRFMVAGDRGITLLPKLAVMNRTNDSGIQYVDFEHPQPSRQISLVIRRSYPRTACISRVVASIKRSMSTIL